MLAFLNQADVEPDLTIEIFLMDGPLAGSGALELVDPPTRPAQLSLASGRRWAPGPETGSTALMDRNSATVIRSGTSAPSAHWGSAEQ